jgi:hypothetical protein
MQVSQNRELEQVLREHEAGWRSNHAMKTLVDHYTRAHKFVVVAGGALVLGLAALSVSMWRRFTSVPKIRTRSSSFEKRAYLTAALLSTTAGLLMALIVAANATNALDPLPGFMLASWHPTPNSAAVDTAVIDWVRSGSGPIPWVVEDKISDRVSWQGPKAIICGALFVLFAALTMARWKALIRRLQAADANSRWRNRGHLAVGLTAGSFTLLLAVMFIANTQGAMAPIAITVLGAS